MTLENSHHRNRWTVEEGDIVAVYITYSDIIIIDYSIIITFSLYIYIYKLHNEYCLSSALLTCYNL